jgi:hypothetical protein
MIIIEEDQLSKRLEKTRRKEIWSIERRVPSHHSSKIILKENEIPFRPK